MSKESENEILPWDMANLSLLEKGKWFMIQVDSQKLFVKIPDEQIEKFLAGEMVEAYHAMSANVAKPMYIPSLMGTMDPWYIAGGRCGIVAPMHPVQGAAIDQALRDAIEEAKKGPKAEIVKPSGKLHLA